MIDEGKIFTALDCQISGEYETLESFPSWRIRAFSDADLEKSVISMRRLLDAIETRLPAQKPPKEEKNLQWCDLLNQEFLPTSSFAYQFLTRIAAWSIPIKYIAPGIYLPNKPDQQPYQSSQSEPEGMSLRIFHIDGLGGQYPSWTPLNESSTVVPRTNTAFSDGCVLVLPYGLGAHGWARKSDGEQMGINPESEHPIPTDQSFGLYQSGFTGFTDLRDVQLWKVLQSWAERLGGIEKFKDADTESHWRKYWIPPSW
ncbi:uncharacterized protein P174DRAFT_458338 [Aspergillus novofumigatus IBT 16806]|uniref:Uncharacterized protein n=1 Tax=Aspergillus novofumigatus (strain IBT 16806) TaxID=1392255 RepID=A0A2I1CJE1_ASPN1|nr:uncharacterized protein P174DRAFT_458338 [Aspergillus novofumigatus IBT 16806]PKX97739.1 hypothetical protein P174DRAFT_458338 [Aspergillus novofumigatus IBT 16806]